MPDNQRLDELFDKYWYGAISDEEFRNFWQLINEDAEGMVSKKLEALWNEHDPAFNPAAKADRQKIIARILEKGREREAVFGRIHHRKTWPRYAAAATLILIVACSYFFFSGQPRTTITSIKPQQAVNHKPAAYTRNISLPDGSIVVLQAGSTLDYPARFSGNTREVSLNGEAYFDIKHDADRPFIIHTDKIKTTVLGTAFDIRADGKKVTVSVTRGKVKVENEKKLLAVLAPNQQITYNIPAALTEQQTVNAQQIVMDWTKQYMVFEGVSFASIAGTLNKRYGVNIEFKNPDLKQCMIVASFSGTETLDKVLEVLCTIRNVTYDVKEGQRIEIDGKGCE